MSCPKCGSRDISIMAGEPIMFRCASCGHQWPALSLRPGYVKLGESQFHWTDVEVTKEKMMIMAGELLRRGSSIEETIEKVAALNQVAKLLPRIEVERLVKTAMSVYEVKPEH
ncbi:MAG: hypothetical protein RXO22_06600 [Thermocladium sp.]|jgi:uncharacterized Zn finger protein|nr:MAG: hypothetical protein AT710_05035 [Thermocladium sp. ECH_B]